MKRAGAIAVVVGLVALLFWAYIPVADPTAAASLTSPTVTLNGIRQYDRGLPVADFAFCNPSPYTISTAIPHAFEDPAGRVVSEVVGGLDRDALTLKPGESGTMRLTVPEGVWRLRMPMVVSTEPQIWFNGARAKRAWRWRSLRPFWTPLPSWQFIYSSYYTNHLGADGPANGSQPIGFDR
jgi:hypothetical protein